MARFSGPKGYRTAAIHLKSDDPLVRLGAVKSLEGTPIVGAAIGHGATNRTVLSGTCLGTCPALTVEIRRAVVADHTEFTEQGRTRRRTLPREAFQGRATLVAWYASLA